MQQGMYNRFPFMFAYGHQLLEEYIKIINTGYIWGVEMKGKRLIYFSIYTLL